MFDNNTCELGLWC